MLLFVFMRKYYKEILVMGSLGVSHIKIDEKKCKSCYLCVDVCPKKLIKKSSLVGQTGEVIVEFKDENKECIGCAQCAMVCPDIAITEVFR